jgi:hypothetical protein
MDKITTRAAAEKMKNGKTRAALIDAFLAS